MSYTYGYFSIIENNKYVPVISKIHHRWQDGGFDLVWVIKLNQSYDTLEESELEGKKYCEQNHILSMFPLEQKEIDFSLEALSKGTDYSTIFNQELEELHQKYDIPT